MTFEATSDAHKEAASCTPRIVRAAELVAKNLRGTAVLDVGCWTGDLARALAGRVECAYTGVDIEPAAPAVHIARRSFPMHHFVTVPSIEMLPFENGSFDVIVFTEVIEHLATGHEVPVLAELSRVLRLDGCIVFSTPYDNLLNVLDPAWFFGHRHYAIDRITVLAQQCGLAVRDIEFSGGVWTALDTNLLYFYKHVLHRSYASYGWLHQLVQRESCARRRGTFATTLWCRLVHAATDG
jgi:SAM-dependent methyltransferase